MKLLFSRREISTLQAENYSLERQLFSYQKSIAFAHSRGAYSYDAATPDGRGEEDDDQYFGERAYSSVSLGDRTMSSDTEYAWGRRETNRKEQRSLPSKPPRSIDIVEICDNNGERRPSMWDTIAGYVCSLGTIAVHAIKPTQRKFYEFYKT